MPILVAERLVLRNDLAELERLTGWIESWAQQDVSPELSFAIQLCLEETVANIIMYGGAKDDRLEIAVELERNGGTLSPVSRTPVDSSIPPEPRLPQSQDRSRRRKLAELESISCAALRQECITNTATAAIG